MGVGFDTISGPRLRQPVKVVIEPPREEVVVSAYRKDEKVYSRKLVFGGFYAATITFFSLAIFFSMTSDTYANPVPQIEAAKKITEDMVLETKSPEKVPTPVIKTEEILSSPKELTTNEAIPFVYKKSDLEKIYVAAEKKYGVSRQILAAVHYVETGQSGDTARSSSAGAVGPMQFMQGTFDAYAQDGDGDGKKSISDVHDAIYTAAKHLAANGAASGNVASALYRYNHSYEYVQRVMVVARSFGYTK